MNTATGGFACTGNGPTAHWSGILLPVPASAPSPSQLACSHRLVSPMDSAACKAASTPWHVGYSQHARRSTVHEWRMKVCATPATGSVPALQLQLPPTKQIASAHAHPQVTYMVQAQSGSSKRRVTKVQTNECCGREGPPQGPPAVEYQGSYYFAAATSAAAAAAAAPFPGIQRVEGLLKCHCCRCCCPHRQMQVEMQQPTLCPCAGVIRRVAGRWWCVARGWLWGSALAPPESAAAQGVRAIS